MSEQLSTFYSFDDTPPGDGYFYAHSLAAGLSQHREALLSGFSANIIAQMCNRNNRLGAVVLGSYGFINLVTGINGGHTHVAQEQLRNAIQSAAMTEGIPLENEIAQWTELERRITPIMIMQGEGAKDRGDETCSDRLLSAKEIGIDFSALYTLGTEVFKLSCLKPHIYLQEPAVVREAALRMKLSTELAMRQIWGDPQALAARLAQLTEAEKGTV